MGTLVETRCADGVATITMDDGKANALSPAMLAAVNRGLDEAEAQPAVVLLTGRPGTFSGGFALPVLMGGGAEALAMLRAGFALSERLLSFPTPVVIACPGHAIAMGAFLLLSGDVRLGAAGPFRIVANEVAIGLTMPRAAVEICRQRLTPAAFNRAVLLSETFAPDDAVPAGFLDRVVDAPALAAAARDTATALGRLDPTAHAATKARTRAATLDALRTAIAADFAELEARP